MDESYREHQAAQFRVALLLKQYKFGAASAAKYLGKSRGLVQSWMQIGNKHYLAKEKIKIKSFEKIVKKLRRRITKDHLDYFIVMRFLELDLPVAFISKVLDLPTSTVRSWRYGKVPCEIKKFFYDPKIVDREFNKLFKNLKKQITQNNIEYFLAMRLSSEARNGVGDRRIGGRLISSILSNHFGDLKRIPEKTVSCWIDGKRKPWDAFQVLSDDTIIRREYNHILDELTYQYLAYHISMKLSREYDWKYSKISEVLNINKELVRGWIKKNRGNPVAKTFRNDQIVESEVNKYLDSKESNLQTFPGSNLLSKKDKSKIKTKTGIKPQKDMLIKEKPFNKELEHELIYHLETIPTGVTSLKVLKSILIDHREATIEEIENVLRKSKQFIQYNGKWILNRYFKELTKDYSIKDELAKINCKEGEDDEMICSD